VGLFADGVAVRQVGEHTFGLARDCVDAIITVDTDQICAAIQDIFEDTRTVVEPAGALAVAGIKRWLAGRQASNSGDGALVAINCGANMNFDRLRHVAERADLGAQREMLLAVEIPEQPGSFRRFCEVIGRRGVTEFNYRYADDRAARIFVGLSIEPGGGDRAQVLAVIAAAGFPATDLTDDEMAKLHVRYMVGGRAAGLSHERLFRFEFPERPGALARFLDAIGASWNISLFHYRNHGSDVGRVLAGIEVPPETGAEFERHLAALGYACAEETGNPAYRAFL
jgi:threonine dehydratase